MFHVDCDRSDWAAMVEQLFASAARVGEPQTAVRTTSEGFWVPEAIARDLFPSRFPAASLE